MFKKKNQYNYDSGGYRRGDGRGTAGWIFILVFIGYLIFQAWKTGAIR
jgi:hypothetical protein